MRIFAIVDEYLNQEIAYLICCGDGNSYIEINDGVGEWDLPFILDYFVKNGERTVPPYWTNRWISQRVVPSDRQNISQILKKNKLTEYDELQLLIISEGRCSQDDCCIKKIKEDELPEKIRKRVQNKITAVAADTMGKNLLLGFSDGSVATVDIEQLAKKSNFEQRMLSYFRHFCTVNTCCNGAFLSLGQGMEFSIEQLYSQMEKLPLTVDILDGYAKNRFVSTKEAMELLGCSRQNIDDLVKRGRLSVVSGFMLNTKMLYRHEVMALLQ